MIIIDDFIKDQSLLDEINNSSEFWKEGYHWWDGWWNESANTLRHRLIEYIWRDYCPLNQSLSIQGFEHWVGLYEPQDGKAKNGYHLGTHFDKDEELWKHTSRIVSPTIGTVFYPDPEIDNTEGGYLKIWDTYNVDTSSPYELIKAKYNRLVVFDAGKLHAVTEVTKGKRRAIAINLWDDYLSNQDKLLY